MQKKFCRVFQSPLFFLVQISLCIWAGSYTYAASAVNTTFHTSDIFFLPSFEALLNSKFQHVDKKNCQVPSLCINYLVVKEARFSGYREFPSTLFQISPLAIQESHKVKQVTGQKANISSHKLNSPKNDHGETARIRQLANDALNYKKTSVYDQDTTVQSLSTLMSTECRVSNIHKVELDTLQQKIEQEWSNPGLNFESSYRYNAYDDNAYRQKAYVGLSWDVLRSGLMENRSKARIHNYEKKIGEIYLEGDQLRHQERCRDLLLIKYFNILKLTQLRKRQKLLESYSAVMEAGYFQGQILFDDLMKVEYETKKNNATIENYKTQLPLSGEEQFPFNKHQFPPLLQVNIEKIADDIKNDDRFSSVAGLQKNILEEKYTQLNDTRLRVFSQVGAVEDDDQYDYGRGLLGVQLTVPLFNNKTKERDSKITKARQVQLREQNKRLLDARRLYNAYGEKFNDAIGMEYKERIVAERLRRSLLHEKLQPQKTRIYEVARYLIELLDVRFEAIAVQEGLYRRLLHLFSLTGVAYKDEYIHKADFKTDGLRARKGERAVYVWSKTFNSMDNLLILGSCRAKSISKIVLSFSTKINQIKMNDFLTMADSYGIEVELMASANKWVFPENYPNIKHFVNEAFSKGSSVHFDIEPYTLPGYKKDRQKYVDAYVEMVKETALLRPPGGTINISLPIHFAKRALPRLNESVNKVYIMAYDDIDPTHLAKKLHPLLVQDTPEIVLSLRPSDFSSELQLEKFIEKFYTLTGVKTYAFQNLKTFLQLIGK